MPEKSHRPYKYEQPDHSFERRILDGALEEVVYVPQSHVRIWHNDMTRSYPVHHHNSMEIIICMENQYTVIANGQNYILNVGDILLIPPHMLHELICTSKGVRFIMLISLEMLTALQDFNTLDPLFMEAYLCNTQTHPMIYQKIYSLFMQIIDEYFSGKTFWETSVYCQLLAIFTEIGRENFEPRFDDEGAPSAARQMENYEKFASLLGYIDAHFAETISLQEAADYMGFSKYYFTRLFRQQIHTTFYDYLMHKRISAAQSLLSSDMTMTEIAFQTGFNNLTSFCRSFRKYTDCSPSEYRLNLRQEHDWQKQ